MIVSNDAHSFQPEDALLVLPKLLDSMVNRLSVAAIHGEFYLMLSECSYIAECERLMEGYFAFHQLLVQFVIECPQVLGKVKEMVDSFMQGPEQRHLDVLFPNPF